MALNDFLTNSQGEYFPNVNKGLTWMGNQVSGSTNPTTRSVKMNSAVTGKPYVTGLSDRGLNATTRHGSVGLSPVDPTKVDVYKGLDKRRSPAKTQATKKTGKPDYSGMSQPLPALAPAAQAVTPMATQDTMSPINMMAPTGLTMDAIVADPSKYAGSDFSNYGAGSLGTYDNSGGLGDYAQIPDGSGGTIGVNQAAYDAIQNPTIGSAGTGSNWVDGLSNFETLQGAAGLGGLAMNAYGMFGSGGTMDVNKKNIELMNQQLANNKELMATRQARGRDISAAFGPRTGLGA